MRNSDSKELILKYIERTNISEKDSDNYHLTCGDLQCMYDIIHAGDISSALLLAFEYGRARGYRLGKRRAARG